jgi:hypothetical protein
MSHRLPFERPLRKHGAVIRKTCYLQDGAAPLGMTTLGSTTLGIIGLIATLRKQKLSITTLTLYAECLIFYGYAECYRDECHYAECHCAECRGAYKMII